MGIRIRSSKIVPPQLPEILHRPRLQRLLQKNKDRRLILVQGQAAQGKSTLVASWVQTILPKTAWVNLDPGDAEATQLFSVLVHSIQRALDWQDISKLLSYPAIDMGPRVPRFRYRDWAYAVWDKISVPLYIVLDGLDRLKKESPSFVLLQELVDQLPSHIHFILLSRNIPPLEIQKFRISQEVSVICNEDLAFTFEEISLFFNKSRAFDLNTDTLKKIHQITEGWTGGLILISENLENLPVKARGSFLLHHTQGRFKQAIFQYFLEEILYSLPDPIYQFLVRSSVFDIIEPELAERVFKIRKSREFLLELAEKNLFIHSRHDAEKGWEFQYHQLFKECLQSRFQVQLTEKQKHDIYMNSGEVFEKTGDHKRAIEFYIKAGAYDKAIANIEKIGMILLEKGRNADLIHWLDALPETRFDQHPWLLYFLCMTRRFTDVKENLKCLPEAMAAFKKQNNIKGQIQSLSAMIEAVIAAGLVWNSLKNYLDEAEKLLDFVPADIYPYEKTLLLSQYGYGHTVRGNLQTGRSALEEAFLLSLNCNNRVLQVTVACHMVVNLTMQNKFLKAQTYVETLDKLVEDIVIPELQVLDQIAKSIMASFRGESSSARRLLDSAQKHVNDNGLIYYLPVVLMYRVFYCVFCNRHDDMAEIGDQLVNLAHSMKNPVIVASTTFFLGLNAYRSYQFQKAGQIMDLADRFCSPRETNIQMQYYAGKIVTCLIFLNRGKNRFQGNGLYDALAYFKKEDCTCLVAETLMVLSLIEKRHKRYDLAHKYLRQGFETSLAAEHRHFLILNRSDLIDVCLSALTLPSKELQVHASSFLCLQPVDTVAFETEKTATRPTSPVDIVQLSVQAGQPAKGVEVILYHAPMLWHQGRFRILGRMIAALPQKMVDASPHLIFWQGMCHLPVSPEIAKERLMRSLDMFEAEAYPDGCFSALSGVLEAVFYQFNGFQMSDFFLEKAAYLETRFGRTQQPEIALKLTGAILQLLIFRNPVSSAARNWIARGWWVSQQVKNIYQAAPFFLPMILLRILQGNLSGAGHLLKRFDTASLETISLQAYLFLQSLKSFHAWLSGDFDAGLQAVEKGLALEKETGIDLISSRFRVHGAASALGAGQYPQAEAFLDQITPVLFHQGIWVQGWYHYVFAWLALVTGNLASSRLHARAGFEKLRQTGCEMVFSCCHLMMAKMHNGVNETKDALFHLNRSLMLSDKYGTGQCRFMALLVRSLILTNKNPDDPEAEQALRDGMQLGRKQQYRFGFAWDPREMADLCARALKKDIEPDYVRSLIILHGLMPDDPPLEIRQWPWPVSLYCLGEFTVKIHGQKVGFSRKTQHKLLDMLKFIIARKGRDVPDYAIQDALWPDSDGDVAHNAFTTTLHRLRKLLMTPDMLIYRKGCVSCNIRMVWVDAWALESFCRSIEQQLDEAWSADRMLSLLNDLLALYRGPFIPDDPAEWAIMERQRFRHLFIEIIRKTAGRFEQHQQWHRAVQCYRQALNSEPLTEIFYENLIRVYAKMGKFSEALQVYKQYEAVLRAELGLSPSARLTGLCRTICGKTSGSPGMF